MGYLSNKITRRDFLKLFGSGALILGLGATVFRSVESAGLFGANPSLSHTAAADSSLGSWDYGVKLLSIPIHGAILPNGNLLYITGSGEVPIQAGGPYRVGILDPVANTQIPMTIPEDIFCGGNCLLPSGKVLFTGGTLAYSNVSSTGKFTGLNCAYEFDFTSNAFTKVSSMAHGRWYPTNLVLPNGNVIVTSGSDELGCTNRLTEIYNPSTKSFSIIFDPLNNKTYCVGSCSSEGQGLPCYGGKNNGVSPPFALYPREHVMPNGLVGIVGSNKTLLTWNSSTGHYVTGPSNAINQNRIFCNSVLLPLQNTPTETGKILLIAGAPTLSSAAFNTCEIVTPNGSSLQSQLTTPMNIARIYSNATILPNGSIFVNGGTSQGDSKTASVYVPEIFDPISQTWTAQPPAKVSRRYHSVALLLPNGTVWTAGTTTGLVPPGELRTEIFSPSYVNETRPTISDNPTQTGGYGGTITIPTPDAANIAAVSLVRISSVTHHFNPDQRLIWLQIQSSDSGSVTVKAPINSNLAPSGYYMIFILDSNSIPSIAKIIQIPTQSVSLSESVQTNDGVSTNSTINESLSESVIANDGASTNSTINESLSESVIANDGASTNSTFSESLSEIISELDNSTAGP